MLFLLRKIRRKLISNNRVATYLLYAVGEIMLVVVGILIAVSIDNWNEKEKILEKEFALLGNLKNDLNSDILNLKRQDSLFAAYEADSEQAIELFYKAKTIQEIDSVFHLKKALWNELFINQNTYQEMINTGSFYTLNNKEIQNAISKYYLLVDSHIEYIRSVNKLQSELLETDHNMFPLTLLITQLKKPRIDLKLIDTTWINNPSSKTYLSFHNYLISNQELSNQYRRFVFIRLITAAEKLKTAINKELESR